MKIAIIGNCQAEVIASLLGVMVPTADVQSVNVREFKLGSVDLKDIVAAQGMTLVQTAHWHRMVKTYGGADRIPSSVVKYPSIFFTAFHPDFVYPSVVRSLMGQPSSAICLYSWLRGWSAEETVGLYRGEVYRALGYLEAWEPSMQELLEDGQAAGFDLRGPLESWQRDGCFVFTPNHPYLRVLADLARLSAERLGLTIAVRYPERMMADPFAANLVWPIYPEVAAALGVAGQPFFKRGGMPKLGENLFDIRTFVERSYANYGKTDRSTVICPALEDPRFALLEDLRRPAAPRSRATVSNPYRGLPAHHFWRRVVEEPKPEEVDPVIRVKFRIDRDTRIATAGSCFAQHVARALRDSGFHYFVTEAGEELEQEEATCRNYGVFSARYGNLYTTRQLLQLFDRSEGTFSPQDDVWRRGEAYVDPFRPEIESGGFVSEAAMHASREQHFAAVRRMWRELNVFVFTLGLTEAWRSRHDGAVVPLAPGVAGRAPEPRDYEFHNFTAEEITEDLRQFMARLRSVNPTARVILTVSPVPLVATYEDRHVLVSTVASKSALRVAAEALSRNDPLIEYFPSYEIITGAFNRGAYFEPDLRNVRPEGVAHVMRVFLSHYAADLNTLAAAPAETVQRRRGRDRVEKAARAVVCEEELLDDG